MTIPARRAAGLVATVLLTAALLAMGLLAACSPEPQPPRAAANTGADAISRDQAANSTYPSEYVAGGALKLIDNHYEDSDLTSAELDALQVSGDLDGDGTHELVVLLNTGTGGSGLFRDLYVLRRQAGGLVVSAPGFLGDRVEVRALRIEHGELVVDLVVQGENDPLCCPTRPVTYRFRLANNELVEITGQRRVFLPQ